MKHLVAALAALGLLLSLVSVASAQVYTRRSYALPDGAVELTGNPARPMMAGINLSEGADMEPFHFPIHVYFGVTDDLTKRYNAVDLARKASEALGGKGGGGRPDMAQAGGPDGSKAEAALSAIAEAIGAA